MIDFYNNKYAYTAGSEFTLDSVNYAGYYNVQNGVVYSGRTRDSASSLLQSTNSIESDVAASEFFKDRTLLSTLALPYQLQDVLLPPGETLNSRIFNDRLYKVYQNFLYTYTKCFAPSIQQPYNVVSVAAMLNGGFSWQTNYDAISFAPITIGVGIIGFNQASKIIAAPYTRQPDNYTLIAAFSGSSSQNSKLLLIDAKDPTVDSLIPTQASLQYDYIDVATNKYKGITSVALLNNLLYVCDAGNNQIYKYDVADLLNQDKLTNFKRVFIESIGGIGTISDNSKFNAPDQVYAFASINKIFVNDAGNKCIKVYDSNFIHQTTIAYPVNSNQSTRSIAFYEPQQLIFILVYDAVNDSYFFNVYDADLNFVEQQTFDISLALIGTRTEKLLELHFSYNDSNVVYLVGEQYVYKLYLNQMQQSCKWLPYNLSNAQLRLQPDAGYRGITVLPSSNDYDIIFAYGCTLSANFTGNIDRVWFIQDNITFDSVVADKVVSFYTLDNFGINDSELLQGFVINKELFKMVYNIFTLRNLIRGKFAIRFDVANNVVADNYAALSDAEADLLKINYNQNMFVHENESMQSPDALNRVLEKVYLIQDSLLTVVKAVYTNIAFSTTPGTSAVIL